ncbi:GbsR/MarR family transcriptional regulator [Ornithinimicrobium cavernae]|uniref:GbsR/MarR family transcriptional regulator n=1 Tax=Ornithinimicrobium cavernae TaxID=2666047 RepID=UPI000D694E6D|nr:MarR family transcriptional regulator [Ornithinimicrobium cavernae]
MSVNEDTDRGTGEGAGDPRAEFVDAMGLLVEEAGWLPRMSGRVLAWLLVAGEPQTQADIGRRVNASAATMSTVTRSLLDKRLIRRVARQGQHATYLMVREDAWLLMEEDGLRTVRRYRELAEGVEHAVPDVGPKATLHIQLMKEFFTLTEERIVEQIRQVEELHERLLREPPERTAP